jgi:NAD(P)-dependent dehydrogenase (short-subunit alcohol dehydrogenase family)
MFSKITLITGGSRGIGKKIINDLLIQNHKLINLSRKDCDIKDENLLNINLDINDKNTHNIITDITKKYKIDNFIHNAGITDDVFFHKMKYNQWNNVINTNYVCLYNLLNPIVNQMRENNNGNIILISSVNANTGSIGQTNYSSSKSALFGFTKSLSLENANKNILINCICPGYIKTEMTDKIKPEILKNIKEKIPLKKLGTDEDISSLIKYLLNDNKYMTGSIININGGLY